MKVIPLLAGFLLLLLALEGVAGARGDELVTVAPHRAGAASGNRDSMSPLLAFLTQLSHQTKKYDLKSKHCGAQSDLGTTRAKVVEALTEVRRAKIDGPALIFDDQLCELHSSNTDASTSASSRSMPNVLGKGSDF